MPLHDFHFIRPEWVWAIIPTLLVWLWLTVSHKKQSGWQSVIPAHLYDHMLVGQTQKVRKPAYSVLLVVWIIALLALAGPTWERLPQPVYQLKNGHVIVLDMSLSMRATDVTPDRMTRAKYKAIDLVNYIGEGEMGLVAYAGDAFVISPLTKDAQNISALLPSLSPEIMPVPGSDPLLGIERAAELLTNAGYSKGAIYWITDGIDNKQQTELQRFVKTLPFTLNVLAVGTKDGAPIKQVNGELLKDASGGIVVPRVNENAIASIARAGGGTFQRLATNDSDIKGLVSVDRFSSDSESSESDDSKDNNGDRWSELGPYLLLLLLPFVAYGFRKGVVICLLIGLYLPLSTETSYAQTSAPVQPTTENESPPLSWWEKPFLNRDQEGFAHYAGDDFGNAANTFKSPQWQGAAHYKAGNYEDALRAFEQVDGADALYNQGNALAKMGDLDAAIERYQQALSIDPDHKDAAENKALLEALKKQQEQQQQQQQQQNGDDNPQDQSENGDSQQNQNNENQTDENQQGNGDQQSQSQQNNEAGEHQDGQSGDQQSDTDERNSPSESESRNAEDQDSDTENEAQSPQQSAQQEQQDGAEQPVQGQAGELTDEEKEQQQRIENLMRKVPDDPAFLLKRKMQLEAQKRQRQRMPSNRSDW